MYNLLMNIYFSFQTDEVMIESLNMFDTQMDESMNNEILYVSPKNKTMDHRTSLNNRICCVVEISIFRLKKYWHTVYNLMELNVSPTLK